MGLSFATKNISSCKGKPKKQMAGKSLEPSDNQKEESYYFFVTTAADWEAGQCIVPVHDSQSVHCIPSEF